MTMPYTKIGKLEVRLRDDSKLGTILEVNTENKYTKDGFCLSVFEIRQGIDEEYLTLTLSKNTALLLADYIDKNLGMD